MRRRHSYNNSHDLFQSMVNGTSQDLNGYLKNGGNVNLTGPDGTTLLLQVCA